MKILLLPSYFIPEGVSSPYISKNRNQAFADKGWDMVVYTPIPCRGISKELRKEYKSKKFEIMLDGRMTVHRFNLVSEKKNPIIRAFRYFAQNIIQFNRGVFFKDARSCDVMLIASTPPTQGAMAALIKKCTGKPLIYNLQDIFPDSMISTGLAKKDGLLWKIGRIIENFTYRNADKIIVISEDFKKNIMAKGVPEDKIEVIYNWVDQSVVYPVDSNDNYLFEELGISKEKFRIVYAGNLGNAQNISIILDAAAIMARVENMEFLIFGSGGNEDEIRERIAKEKLTNVRLLPLQPYENVKFVYSMGDACVVSCKAGLGGSAMPSKTWSILSCGRPVIASFDEGELKMILEKHECGVFTKADDTNAFVEGIMKLYNDRELCKEYGKNGRKFILENLTKEVGTQKYVDVIKSVVKEKTL